MHSMIPADGIKLGDALPQVGGVAVALGDEDRAGAGQVGRRFAQGAARQQPPAAEGLLAVNQHDVLAATAQFPILETVVEQQGVAPELLNGVTAALDAVLVHQHDHVLEVGREHVRLVAGHFGIQQQGFAVRNDARGRGVIPEKELVEQPLVDRGGFGSVAARENGHVPALVAQLARELLNHGSFPGAADGEVSDRNDLHAEGAVAQDADIVKEAAGLDGGLEDLRAPEKEPSHERLARPAPLLDDHLQEEGFQFLCPRTQPLTHLPTVCQGAGGRASRRRRAAGNRRATPMSGWSKRE